MYKKTKIINCCTFYERWDWLAKKGNLPYLDFHVTKPKHNITMDPTTDVMDKDTQVDVAKKMFIGGFFFLPWLWMVNFLLFRPNLSRKSCPEDLKWYANTSFYLFFVGMLAIMVWYIVFVCLRSPSWDVITILIPRG